MENDNVVAIQELMDSAGSCSALARSFVNSFRLKYHIIKNKGAQLERRHFDELSASMNRAIPKLVEYAANSSTDNIDYETFIVVEDANLNFLRPVRFRDNDYLTAAEAASHIAMQLIDDCCEVTSWDEYPHLSDSDRLKDCRRLLRVWRPLTDEVFRDWSIQIEVECRRAILSEYEWIDRLTIADLGSNGTPDESKAHDKVAKRRRRLREIQKAHGLRDGDHAGLFDIAKDDSAIKEISAALAAEFTKQTVINDARTFRRASSTNRGKR